MNGPESGRQASDINLKVEGEANFKVDRKVWGQASQREQTSAEARKVGTSHQNLQVKKKRSLALIM